MNYFIIIILIFLLIFYYNTKYVLKTIPISETNTKIGIINYKLNSSLLNIFVNILNQNNHDFKIVLYKNEDKLYDDLNCNNIQFIVDNDYNFYNNYFGLDLKSYENINFVCGLTYNYIYFVIRKQLKNNIYSLNDLSYTNKKIIIGVEKANLKFLKLILETYKIKIHNFNENTNEIYNIFYKILDYEELIENYNNNVIDSVFFLGTYNDTFLEKIINNKNHIFLNLDDIIFSKMYNNFYINEEVVLKKYYNLLNQYSFQSKKIRLNLIGNNSNDNLSKEVCSLYFKNFNLINNKIMNTNSKEEIYDNFLIKPLDLIYINKNIKINNGSYDYFKSLNYIKDENTNTNTDKFKCYWKYKTIGLKKFVL